MRRRSGLVRKLIEILTNDEFYTNVDMATRSDAVCDTSGEAEVEARWWRRPTAADCFHKTTLRLFNQRQEASPPPLSIRRNVSKKIKKQPRPSRARAGGPRLTGHLVGKPSSRQLSRSAKQPPASLHAPDINASVKGGGATNKSKCCCVCWRRF